MTLSVIAGGSSKIPPPSSELSSLSTGKQQNRINFAINFYYLIIKISQNNFNSSPI